MAEAEGARTPISGSRRRAGDVGALALLVLLSLLLFFYRLGSLALFDADEPAFAEAAREMLLSGDWITPQFNFEPRFDKPVLFYWLIGLSFNLFGIGEFAARFWSATFAVGMVLSIYLIGRQVLAPRGALIAALAFGSNVGTAILARAAVTDMTLVFFMTWTLYGFFSACRDTSRRRGGFLVVAYLAMGMAVLTKGPIGLLLPLLVIGAYLLIRGRAWATLLSLRPVTGLLLFAVVTLPWYLLVLREHGWDFVQGFLVKHHLIRYMGVVSGNTGAPYYFLPVVVLGFFPWSAMLPKAFGDLWRIRVRLRGDLSAREEILLFGWVWFGVIFVFFSLSGTKLPSYIFPAFPALALLAGASGEAVLYERGMPGREGTAFDWLVGGIAGILAIGLCIMPLITGNLRPRISLGPAPYLLAVIFLIGAAIAVLARRKGRGNVALAGLMAPMALTILLSVRLLAPSFQEGHQKVLREISEAASAQLGPDGLLVAYDLNAPSLVFYARRQVLRVGRCEEARIQQLAASHRRLLIVSKAAAEPSLMKVQGIFPLDRRGGYVLYSNHLRR